jgi:hypothetical protein
MAGIDWAAARLTFDCRTLSQTPFKTKKDEGEENDEEED